jgi:hypothetical protein
MPIVHVHGVSVRDTSPDYAVSWEQIKTFLRTFIAPVIADDPENVYIEPAYWGDVASRFYWDEASRPPSPLLGMGGAAEPTPYDRAIASAELRSALGNLPASAPAAGGGGLAGGLAPAGPVAPAAAGAGVAPQRLKDLTPTQLSDLAAAIVDDIPNLDAVTRAHVALAADAVAHDPNTFQQLAAQPDSDAELAKLQDLIRQRFDQEYGGGLAGQGFVPAWLSNLTKGLDETLDRAADLPGYIASRAVAEVRGPLNSRVTHFIGDVFYYLANRGDAAKPGGVPEKLLTAVAAARANQLQRNGEPLIIMTHSMGGQLVYDLVSHFLPNSPQYKGTRVDMWCATASQVGLFEELKLFKASTLDYSKAKKNKVPFPDRRFLGEWSNVWDHNDFASYTAKGIFEGVDDWEYNSGMSAVEAHGGYLKRPSFFREFAARAVTAKNNNWWRP